MSDHRPSAAPAVRWLVTPLETPALSRHCPNCRGSRTFRSSGRFRVNGNGRRLDVWLIYWCETCEHSWKLPIHERCLVQDLPDGSLERYLANDSELAALVASDPAVLRPVGAEFHDHGAVKVERDGAEGPGAEVSLELRRPVSIRLDRLLAAELKLSRGRLKRLAIAGDLGPDVDARALRRPVRSGLRFRIPVA